MATIRGTITDGSNYIAASVSFYPVSSPDASVVVGNRTTIISDPSDGTFTVSLTSGYYHVKIAGQDKDFQINVPSGSGTYDISDIWVTTQEATEAVVSLASATTSGTVKTNTTSTDPVVYLTTEVDDMVDVDETEITVAASTWTWVHGYNYPLIQILDSSRNVIHANVSHTAADTVQVEHQANQTGFIVAHR